MNMEKEQLSIEVAKLYYQLEYSQQQIANELKISRPTISRLLKYAKEQGFVKISITDPFSSGENLADKLRTKYHLQEVIIAKTPSENYDLIIDQITTQAARYLAENSKDGDILGISWGTTVYHIAKKMQIQSVKNVQVVQLKGSITHSKVTTYAHETLSLFAQAYQTQGVALPLPVIFDNAQVKTVVESDRHIQDVIQLGKKSNIAVYTVGTTREEALLFQLGYLSQAEKKHLQANAVGDICSRFYDAKGEIAIPAIDRRTIGINLEELREKECSLLVAGGKHKVAAIKGALEGRYANVLITDYWTAKELADS